MIGHFQTLLHAIVAHPLQSVDTLPLLTPAERQQLLVEWNATELPDVQDTCVPAWVEQQAALQPAALAVVFGEAMLTPPAKSRCGHGCRCRGLCGTIVGDDCRLAGCSQGGGRLPLPGSTIPA